MYVLTFKGQGGIKHWAEPNSKQNTLRDWEKIHGPSLALNSNRRWVFLVLRVFSQRCIKWQWMPFRQAYGDGSHPWPAYYSKAGATSWNNSRNNLPKEQPSPLPLLYDPLCSLQLIAHCSPALDWLKEKAKKISTCSHFIFSWLSFLTYFILRCRHLKFRFFLFHDKAKH